MAKQTIADLLRELAVPEYAGTFERIASRAPVTFKNGTAHYTLDNGQYRHGGQLPEAVEEWKTLYFDVDSAKHGRFLAGMVLPLKGSKLSWKAAAQALDVTVDELHGKWASADALPRYQTKGSCGPFIHEGYGSPVRLIFDEESALWADYGTKTGWKLPGDEKMSVYVDGVRPVCEAASQTADAQYAPIRKV